MNSFNRLVYWPSTVLFALLLGSSGLTYLMGASFNADGLVHLGFPLYMLGFLGLAKLLGAVAIAVPRSHTLTEWAYAGYTFELLGASWAHFSTGDGPKMFIPLTLLAIMFVSYGQWRLRPVTA